MSDTDEEPPEVEDDADGGGTAEEAGAAEADDSGGPEAEDAGTAEAEGARAAETDDAGAVAEADETVDDGAADGEGATEGESDEEADESVLGPAATSLVAKVAIEDERLATDVEDHLLEAASEREAAEQRATEAEERASELESKLKRKQADFENYKKRAERRREKAEERATRDVVERLLDVRDDLVRAVEADHDDVESLREGVKMTLTEFDRVLDAEGVTEVAPDPGDAVDPQRHEVMLRVESDQPADTVAEVHRSGFEMGDTVVRPAQVTVSEGPEDGDDPDIGGGPDDLDGTDSSGGQSPEDVESSDGDSGDSSTGDTGESSDGDAAE